MTTYVLWRQAFLLVESGRHRGPEGERKLRSAARRIRERRSEEGVEDRVRPPV